jgi:hypothetical protein
MALAEYLDPTYLKQLTESLRDSAASLSHLSSTLQNLTRVGFDESNRLYVRVGYIDDGYVRVRDTSATIDILDMLREFSWTFYNIAETNKNVADISSKLDVSGAPDSPPPSKGVQILGFDGTYSRRIRVTSDGKLLAVLG